MKPRRRNRTIYTGPVGAKLAPPNARPKRVPRRVRLFLCVGGPMTGAKIALDANGDRATLPFTMRGATGFYAPEAGATVEWRVLP